jgi:hypothetical protein
MSCSHVDTPSNTRPLQKNTQLRIEYRVRWCIDVITISTIRLDCVVFSSLVKYSQPLIDSVTINRSSNNMSSWNSEDMQRLCFQVVNETVMRTKKVPQSPTPTFAYLIRRNAEIKTSVNRRVGQEDNFAHEVSWKVSPY